MKHYAINFYKYTCLFTLLFFLGISVSAQVSSFPYEEDFESGAGGWTLNYNNTSSWQLGSPVATIINSAASGSNAWVTNLTGSYFPDEDGYLLSPEFDFSLIVNPYVEFSLWWNSEGDWDGAVLQSSTDNQTSWQNVGTVGSGTNWYNTVEIASYPGGQPEGWSGSKDLDGNDSGGWLTVSQDVFHLIGETSVFFRLAFASDNIIQDEGIGFDLFKIYDPFSPVIRNIPDPQFEQALIDLGIDSDATINASVLQDDIELITNLNLTSYDISNFEGLQYFSLLTNFTLINNQALTISNLDFSGFGSLTGIAIYNTPNLNTIDVTQNIILETLLLSGNSISSIDVSNNLSLTELVIVNNNITELNTQNNLLLTYLSVGANPITSIDVSNLEFLETFNSYETQIEVLDLSNLELLETFYGHSGSLKALNLKNGGGNANNATFVDVSDNPDLQCILVDNIAWAEGPSGWIKDATATYVENSVSIDIEAQDIPIQYDPSGNYQSEIDDWLANNGGAVASSDCGQISWSKNINHFVHEYSNSIIYEVEFYATDVFGNNVGTFGTLYVQNINHFEDEIYGTGETICDDIFDLNTVITDIDPTASLNASDIESFSFSRVPNGEPNEGPAGASFDDTEVDFPDTGAGSYTYLFKVTVQKSLAVYNPNTGNLEQELFEDEANITLNDKTVAFETTEFIGSEPSNTISSIQDLTDLLTITPDPDVLIPQNGPIDLNQYWTPSVYSGAGTYTFDPTNAFPNCPSNAVSITVCDIISIDQPAQDLVISYDGNGNQEQVNNWLNSNGGANLTSTCGDPNWEYFILNDNLIDTDFDTIDDQLIVEVLFTANDDFGDVSTTALIIYNGFATAGESAGNGDTICESTYPVSDLDDGLSFPGGGANYDDPKYNSSVFEIDQLDGAPGLGLSGTNIDFPDTGAGQFTYNFNFKVLTTLTIGTESLDIESLTNYTANNVTVAFDPGPDITLEICDFNNVNLLDLYNELQIQLPVDPTEFNEAEDFGNVFEPENSWYNETDDLEANPDIPPLTEITEPGVYQFNAKKFLEDCSGKPVYVTLVESCTNTLGLKLFLEGAYNMNTLFMNDDLRSSGMLPTNSPYADGLTCNQSVFNASGNNAIVDWVWVELRDSANQETVIHSTSALMQVDGDIVDIDGVSPLSINIPNGNYYLVLSHRNHLGVLSLNTVILDGSSLNIDFTTSSELVVGASNAISDLGSGIYGLFSGDFNGDGQVQNTDKIAVEQQRGLSGYNNADIDMNGEVQNSDLNNLLNPNLGKGEQFTRHNLNAKRKNK